jgi:hypothetical protein
MTSLCPLPSPIVGDALKIASKGKQSGLDKAQATFFYIHN